MEITNSNPQEPKGENTLHNSDKIPRPIPLCSIPHIHCPYQDDQRSSCGSEFCGHEGATIQERTIEFSIRIVYRGFEDISLKTVERIENDIVEGLNTKWLMEYQRNFCFPVSPFYTARRAGLGVLEIVEDEHQPFGRVEFKP